jgi:hypothetical protein
MPRTRLISGLRACCDPRGKVLRHNTCSLSCALLLGAALAAGCSKHPPAAGANAATNAAAPDAPASALAAPPSPRGPGPMVPPATAPTIADSGDVNAILGQLSMELRRYVVRSRSVPKNFDDSAAKAHLQVPPAPAGKKYAIENQAVVLVKR